MFKIKLADYRYTQTKRQRIFKGYYLFKTFYGRANTYVSVPLSMISFYAMATLWLKLYLGFNNQLVINVGTIAIFLFMFTIGYLDVRYGIIKEENSFANQFSPELLETHKMVTRGKK